MTNSSSQVLWYTASDLAGMPGMPKTYRGVKSRADKAEWLSQPNAARGGGKQYHIDSLPAETKAHIFKSSTAVIVDQVNDHDQKEEDVSKALKALRRGAAIKWASLPDGPKKKKARAREWLLKAMWAHRRISHLNATNSRKIFIKLINGNNNSIAIPTWVESELPIRAGIRNLSYGTLVRWESDYKKIGVMALVPTWGDASRDRTIIDDNDQLKRVVLGCLIRQPHITAKKIVHYLAADHSALPRPSARTLQRWLKNWKLNNSQLWMFVTNPDQWKNRYMSAVGSHHSHIERLNQTWEMDSTPADVMLTDGRHSVIAVIDLYSRRLKYYVSKSSTAAAVCQVFRRAVLAWGVPELVRIDNGKDYVSDRFLSVLDALQIDCELCMPFASEEKGTIERSMRTMSHGITDLLPGFIGHNVAERKQIEARRAFSDRIMNKEGVVEITLSADEFQKKLDQWSDHIYMHDEHSGTGMGNKTPFMMAAEWTGGIDKIENERALDLLLAPLAGTKTITKKGIRHQNYYYYSAALFAYHGEVQVRLDEHDIGRLAVYQNDEFITWVECPELTGNSPKEAAAAVKHAQKKLMMAQAKELKENKKAVKKDIFGAIVQHRIDESKNITAFPHQSTPYNTPGLAAAAAAAEALDEEKATKKTTEEAAAHRALIERMNTPTNPVTEILDTPKKRYNKAYSLEQRLAADEPVNSKDEQWLTIYKTGAEYAGQKIFSERFKLHAN